MTNFYAELRRSFAENADAPLIEWASAHYSGSEIDSGVGRYAAALSNRGVRAGDRVAAQVDKSYENILLYLATLQMGAIYLPLNTAYTSAEVEYFLSDARPRVFVCTPSRSHELKAVAEHAGVTHVLTLDANGTGSLPTAASQATPLEHITPLSSDDLAVICYTSGTTGRSKGAMITHGNLTSNARTLVDLWGFTSDDVLLHALPLYHVHGLFVALHCALLSGAKILLQARFEAREALDALSQATVMMGVPTFYTRLLADARLNAQSTSHMRLFISGSAPLLAETFSEFERRTGIRILERYGMTETGMITSNPLQGERRAGTVGLPLPGVSVRVTNVEGEALSASEIGGVEVKGPNVFKGYWNMPEKTAAEFRADGYFITGDLGFIDDDGYLHLVGRGKDLIISGGLNVYPKEIEEVIDALPGVIESAVFAIPHPDFGEAVGAAVTLEANATATPESIIADARQRLAAFKVPKRVYVLDELPRNAMGKVQKTVLRERFGKEFG